MQLLASLGFGVLFLALVLVAGVQPRRSRLSRFELERRRGAGDHSAADELDRELVLGDIVTLQRALVAILLVFVVVVSISTYGWVPGVIVGIVAALSYGRLAQLGRVERFATDIYQRYELHITQFVRKYPRIPALLRNVSIEPTDAQVGSRQELEHLLETSEHLLTRDEKSLIANGLHFSEKTVESIMTPRGVVETIADTETLGPLVLDDLHKTGHSRFPVTDGDIDHIVGVLHIRDLLTLGNKTTQTASEAMEKRVYYINEDQTLDHALVAFLKTRHHLFVVVNGYRETAGIITLEDVMEALLGRKIVDEFDLHDDLRAVAAREAKNNNDSQNGTTL